MIALSQDNARQKLRVLYQRADAHLKHHNWLANGQRSGADAYLYVTLRWAKKSVWIFLVWMRYQRSLSVWRLIPGCRLHYRRKG